MVEKYLSLNKVQIDVAGEKDKLFVVRELDSYIGLQASNFTRQIFSFFSEKIIRQIRDSSKSALFNVEQLGGQVDSQGKRMVKETVSLIKKSLLQA